MITMKVSKDVPLSEITLRRYEKPYELKQRDLVKKLCLSTGLLQPGDSRDVIVDIFHALLIARSDKKELSSEEIRNIVINARNDSNLPLNGIASSNIRRQLKRLRDIFLVEKVRNRYRVTEFITVNEIFEEKIEQYLLQTILSRVKEYYKMVDDRFT